MHLAFLIAAFVTIGSQEPQAQAGNLAAVTVSGCLAQAARTGSLSDDAGIGTTATPNTAGVEANSGDPVNAYVLLDATPITTRSEDRRDRRTTYGLQGREFELASHRGHRIEVVGELLPSAPPLTTSEKVPAAATQRIRVVSIKMLSTRCPATP
jgi:hypothetical protein